MSIFKLFSGVYGAMEEAIVISPEVQALFDTVRRQAKEYANAFLGLERERIETERMREQVHDLFVRLKKEVDESFEAANKNISNSMLYLDTKTDQIDKIYSELSNIKDLKHSLNELQEGLKVEENNMQSFISDSKSKTALEIESNIIKLKAKIDKEIEVISKRTEYKMNLNLRQMEGRIYGFSQTILEVNDKIAKNESRRNAEIDSIKDEIRNIQRTNVYSAEMKKEKISFQADTTATGQQQLQINYNADMIQQVKSDMDKIRNEVNQFNKIKEEINTQPIIEDLEKIKEEKTEIEEHIEKIRKSGKLHIILIITSFVLYFILFIFTLINSK
ncbi:MAG: hypothetical protein HW421_1848 [Ignavibacteria bacterium]|nr:hypothetical protein [Ignavibacteria bacterium]